MFRVHYSNQTAALKSALIEELARGGYPSLLTPVEIVIPNRHVQRYLEFGIAEGCGVASNLEFSRLQGYVGDWAVDRLRSDARVMSAHDLQVTLVELLSSSMITERPGWEPLRDYVGPSELDRDARELRIVRLAIRLSQLFEEYSFSRPEMIRSWWEDREIRPASSAERWQYEMFREIRDKLPSRLPLPVALAQIGDGPSVAERSASSLHVFGFSYMARAFQWALAKIATQRDVHVYALNPCREYWEDIRRGSGGDDPFGFLSDTDNRLLQFWGRPGREHIALLNEITDADFHDCFVAPASTTSALGALHDYLLHRRASPAQTLSNGDRSIEVVACPNARREVEEVAELIWERMHDDPTLRFNEISVVVSDAASERYLPHIDAVFRSAQRIPFHLVDFRTRRPGSVEELVDLFLDLPGTAFRRSDVLAVLNHPIVAARFPNLNVEERVELCDQLGVFHGGDRSAHAGTYIDCDVVNWDQGVRRIVLGELMSAEVDGVARFVSLANAGDEYLPLARKSDEHSTLRFAEAIRGLLRFADATRGTRSVAEWRQLLQRWIADMVVPRDERDEAELRALLFGLETLGDAPLQLSYPMVVELLRARSHRRLSSRGEYLADGVSVAAMLPMRALPFRHVFVMGLGEGAFPSPSQRDTIDLRSRSRAVGDVGATERDLYVFLEVLLAAQEGLVLSYVAKDEFTGDEIAPAPVIEEILRLVLPRQRVRSVPLRRFDDGRVERALFEARFERLCRELGAQLREQLGRELTPEDLLHFERSHAVLLQHPVSLAVTDESRNGPNRVSLSALRAFLRCPLQGWAKFMLGISEEDDASRDDVSDEPFSPANLEHFSLLNDVFFRVLRGADVAHEYARTVAERSAAGRWPVGMLAERTRLNDAVILKTWERVYREKIGALAPRITRFGHEAHFRDADETVDPISVIGVDMEVLIEGSTGPYVGGDAQIPGPLRCRPRPNAEGRFRDALAAFLDHLAMLASGHIAEGPARLHLIDGRGDCAVDVRTVTQERARSFLVDLAEDLLVKSHAYFLPVDVAISLRRNWNNLDVDRVAKAIDVQRKDGGASRFGPIRHPTDYESPGPEEAIAILRRRYGLFFESCEFGS